MSELEIHLFGYPEFLIDGHPLQFKRRKTVALLAYLSVETGQGGSSPAGIGREILADLFWPDCSQEQAGAYLRQSLWECANQIGEERIIRGSGMISLDFTTGIQVDANTFDAYFRHWNFSGITSEIPTELIAEITHLYRGNFLAGFTLKNCPSFDHWQSLQVETLRHHMAQLLESCTKIWAEKGNFPQAEIFASQWLALDTINESAHRALMSIFSQTGRFSAAIRQFNTCCAILKEELEVEPEPQTLNLYRKIREHRAAGPINEADRLPAHPAEKKTNKPSGTVTFVFTDIQGSTQLWEQQKEAMQYAFQRQEEIIRSAMELHGGYVYKMIGDAFQIAFATAKGALMAALAAQRNLQSEKWDPRIGEVRVRMALHTGVTEERGDDYVGPVLNRVARLLNAGHGGQVLLTEAVYQLVRDELTSDTSLQFLDEYHLKDLITPERVYQVNGQGLNADFPPLRADSGYRSVLPFQSRPFIGRKTELGRIQEMLRDPDCRMITILGIGGSGKTRLAVRAAQESQDFQDGVCFCALENAESVQGIILAIAEEANLSLNPLPGGSITLENAREQLFQYLAGKQKLLVLDNFEHLVAYADFVSVLLEAAPRIKILVTSRQRLNLTGEWLLELGGLSYPASETQGLLQEFSAVQLFVRTAERNSTLCPGPEDWSAILRICQLLEGIPLGLEMAAAWTRTLSCLEIAEEIVRNQDFLTTSWRGMPQRHQTLRTVFEHSWRLLSGLEREVLSQLSIFQGGFSREGALVVANAPLSLISAFVDKALIRRITSGRFEIHPLLRRYAFEKLSANSELLNDARSRMANFYTEWLIRMNEKIKGKDHLAGLVAIRGEMANIRASLEWLVNQVDVERLSQVMPVWILYHVMNDRKFEMVQSSQLLVDLIKRLQSRANTQDISETVLLALANAAVRFFCIDRWAEVEVEQYLAESMRLIRTIPDHIYKAHALILNCVGKSSLKLAETVGYLHESIRLFEMFGDLWGCALGYMALGDLHTIAVLVPDDARAEYNRGLQDFTRVGSAWGRALCIAGLMYLEGKVGNLGESYNFGITCLAIFAEMENFERMVSIRHYLAEITEKLGRLNEASGLYQANYAYFSQQGNEAAKQYYQQKLAELACESIA